MRDKGEYHRVNVVDDEENEIEEGEGEVYRKHRKSCRPTLVVTEPAPSRWTSAIFPLMLVASLLFCILWLLHVDTDALLKQKLSNKKKDDHHHAANDYVCPALYEENGVSAIEYLETDAKLLKQDVDAFLENYQTMKFDYWSVTYEKFKRQRTKYKSTRYADLKNGDTIYESACGVGMNLLVTLDILKEENNVTNLTVYGNDFVADSVVLANRYMDHGILNHTGARKGAICQSDSTNLSFVPSNTFDLVFTGYIAPVWDPLQTNLYNVVKDDETEIRKFYAKVCDTDELEYDILRRQMVKVQEDWFTAWFGEMVRIAKPGAPVIAESVSYPWCDNRHDWDGVNQTFWTESVERGVWDVQVDSLQIDEAREYSRRYHVFTRKKR